MRPIDPTILEWILRSPSPGAYSVAIVGLQSDVGIIPTFVPCNLPVLVRDLETKVLKEALAATGWHAGKAAALVNIKRSTFAAKLRRLGIVRGICADRAGFQGDTYVVDTDVRCD